MSLNDMEEVTGCSDISSGVSYPLKNKKELKMPESEDIFDSILNLEQTMIEEGKEKGIEAGKKMGLEEGHQLGLQKGNEIGTEIGYYAGCVSLWKNVSHITKYSTRAMKAMNELEKLINSFSVTIHPQDTELLDIVERIRGKFKQVSSLIGISYKPQETLSF